MKDGTYTAVLTGADTAAEVLQGVRVYTADVNARGGPVPVSLCSWVRMWDDDQLVKKLRDGTPCLVAVIAGMVYGCFPEPPVTGSCPPPGGA